MWRGFSVGIRGWWVVDVNRMSTVLSTPRRCVRLLRGISYTTIYLVLISVDHHRYYTILRV